MVSIASESIPASRELVRNPSRVVQLYEVTRILSNVAHKQKGGQYGIHRGWQGRCLVVWNETFTSHGDCCPKERGEICEPRGYDREYGWMQRREQIVS